LAGKFEGGIDAELGAWLAQEVKKVDQAWLDKVSALKPDEQSKAVADKLRELARSDVSLVVSVDCGIASIAEAEVAREVGLELIVTDHHEMKVGLDGPLLPAAATIVRVTRRWSGRSPRKGDRPLCLA
jgi:hypothetical protein